MIYKHVPIYIGHSHFAIYDKSNRHCKKIEIPKTKNKFNVSSVSFIFTKFQVLSCETMNHHKHKIPPKVTKSMNQQGFNECSTQ